MDDLLAADLPCAVGAPEVEAVVPGLDGRDGALGAESAGRPPSLGLRGSDDVEGAQRSFYGSFRTRVADVRVAVHSRRPGVLGRGGSSERQLRLGLRPETAVTSEAVATQAVGPDASPAVRKRETIAGRVASRRTSVPARDSARIARTRPPGAHGPDIRAGPPTRSRPLARRTERRTGTPAELRMTPGIGHVVNWKTPKTITDPVWRTGKRYAWASARPRRADHRARR